MAKSEDVAGDGLPHPELDFSFQVWDSNGFLTYSEHVVGTSDGLEGPPQTVDSFCSEPTEVAGAPECTQRNCSIRFPGSFDFHFITFFECDGEILVADPEVMGLGTPVFDAQSMYDACLQIPESSVSNEISDRKAQDRQNYKASVEATAWGIVQKMTFGLAVTVGSAFLAPPAAPFVLQGTIVAVSLETVTAFGAVVKREFDDLQTYNFALDEGCKLLQAEEHCYVEARAAFPFDSLGRVDQQDLIWGIGAHGPTVVNNCNVGTVTP